MTAHTVTQVLWVVALIGGYLLISVVAALAFGRAVRLAEMHDPGIFSDHRGGSDAACGSDGAAAPQGLQTCSPDPAAPTPATSDGRGPVRPGRR